MVLTIHLNTPPGGRSRIAKNFRSIRPMGIRAREGAGTIRRASVGKLPTCLSAAVRLDAILSLQVELFRCGLMSVPGLRS